VLPNTPPTQEGLTLSTPTAGQVAPGEGGGGEAAAVKGRQQSGALGGGGVLDLVEMSRSFHRSPG